MIQPRNAPCKRCQGVCTLGCWISGIHQAELNLRAARDSELSRAVSWALSAISPTYSGIKVDV